MYYLPMILIICTDDHPIDRKSEINMENLHSRAPHIKQRFPKYILTFRPVIDAVFNSVLSDC